MNIEGLTNVQADLTEVAVEKFLRKEFSNSDIEIDVQHVIYDDEDDSEDDE